MKPYSDYAEVPQTELDDKWEDGARQAPTASAQPRMSGATRVLLYCTYVACLVCSCLNIALRLWPRPAPVVPWRDPNALERPSPYIDLARVHYSQPFLAEIKPVINFPHVYGLVSTAQPDRNLYEQRRWLTAHGTVTPDEHHVMVTQDVTTLLQWRILDWGMERCRIFAEIPDEATIRSKARNNNIELGGNTTAIQVWRVDTQAELDTMHLTKRNAPKRTELLGTLNVTLGHKGETVEFPCEGRELLSIELVCPSRYCFIDFWQDNEKPLMAFYLMQYLKLRAN